MNTIESSSPDRTVLDWEQTTDIGPDPSREDLRKFFTTRELPGRYDGEIDRYFRTQSENNANIALLHRYYALIRGDQGQEQYDKFQTMDLIARAPIHAERLFDIFRDHPLLMTPYARMAPTPPDDPNDDRPIFTSRISRTLNPDIIQQHLAENTQQTTKILNRHQILRSDDPTYSADNYEQKLASCYDDQVNIWGGVIQGKGGDWLRLRISPPSPLRDTDSWFDHYTLSIKLDEGIVDSPPVSHHQRENLGYLLYGQSVQGVDEAQLLALLTRETSTTDAWDEWIEPYLEKQGLFGPTRD